jgi:hypothetical protein
LLRKIGRERRVFIRSDSPQIYADLVTPMGADKSGRELRAKSQERKGGQQLYAL